MTGLAIAGLATTAAGAGISAYSAYSQGQAARDMARQQAAAQLALAGRQAEAYGAQADEYRRQAEGENWLAGVDQMRGDLSADARSRMLAADIGSTYANAAANGVLVTSASPTDTFAHVLQDQRRGAAEDMAIIRANTSMNVWQRSENARRLLFAANQAKAEGENAILSAQLGAQMTKAQGENAYQAGMWSAAGQTLSGIGSVGLDAASAYKNGLFSGSAASSGAAAKGAATTTPYPGFYGSIGGGW